MKLTSLYVAITLFTLTAQSLPMGQGYTASTADKRDLHALCGGWFCGHTKRMETSQESGLGLPITNSKNGAHIKEEDKELYTPNDKRDLHDLCGGWLCGHTKRSITLRGNIISAIKKSAEYLNDQILYNKARSEIVKDVNHPGLDRFCGGWFC
ncbi:hypothetical protein K7432_012431 [Basidiobolus ranarum]|uniref:Uncharacterized protein n=1 Tax=Basidiobolus ranarum TaxID=34480 RepID=A0ABR2WKT7_9FUNG